MIVIRVLPCLRASEFKEIWHSKVLAKLWASRSGSAIASFVFPRHVEMTTFRPNLCEKAPFCNDLGP